MLLPTASFFAKELTAKTWALPGRWVTNLLFGQVVLTRAVFGVAFVVILTAYTQISPALAGDKPKGENYAFLVGCGEYDGEELRPLKYAVQDAAEFADVLKQSGWRDDHIVLMHDKQDRRLVPEAKKIRKELQALLSRAESADLVVVALSGHGLQYRDDKEAYFCPLDARADDKDTLVPLAWVYEQLDECKASRKLLLVDACRNDPRVGKAVEKLKLESVTRPQAEAVPKGIAALFSCSEGQQSYEDPELGHGVFFHHVLEAWQGQASPDGPLTLDDLVSYVRRETAAYARTSLRTEQAPAFKGETSGEWVLTAGGSLPGLIATAEAAVEKMGGDVRRDDKLPDHPIVGVVFGERARVTPAGLRVLAGIKGLKSLYFETKCKGLTDAGLKEIAKVKSLQDLWLYREITDAGLKELGSLKNLQVLELPNGITDEGLKNLAGLENLRELNCRSEVTGSGLAHLGGLKKLEKISLMGATDAGVKGLAQIKRLNELWISGNELTDAGLAEIGKMKSVATLQLYLGPKVTNRGLKEIGRMQGLKSLNLDAGPSITDIGLLNLIHLKGLTFLDIAGGDRLTEAGVKNLESNLPPGCKVFNLITFK